MNPTKQDLRLVRGAPETRQEKALRKIRERQKNAPHGEGTVDAQPAGNYLPVNDILDKATRRVK